MAVKGYYDNFTKLVDGQLSFNGLLLGEGTDYGITSITGWFDLPDLNDQSVSRPREHGEYIGPLLAGGRIVEVTGLYHSYTDFDELHYALMEATAVRQEFSELRVHLHGQELASKARVTKRSIPIEQPYGFYAEKWALRFKCPDPRRYSDPQTASRGLRESIGGMNFPMVYPLQYSVSPSNVITLTNQGTADSYPVFTVQGPLQGFTIRNVGHGFELTYEEDLPAGETLVIDLRKKSVKLNGVDKRTFLTKAQWWSVDPGETASVLLTTPGDYSSSALLTFELKSAWW